MVWPIKRLLVARLQFGVMKTMGQMKCNGQTVNYTVQWSIVICCKNAQHGVLVQGYLWGLVCQQYRVNNMVDNLQTTFSDFLLKLNVFMLMQISPMFDPKDLIDPNQHWPKPSIYASPWSQIHHESIGLACLICMPKCLCHMVTPKMNVSGQLKFNYASMI